MKKFIIFIIAFGCIGTVGLAWVSRPDPLNGPVLVYELEAIDPVAAGRGVVVVEPPVAVAAEDTSRAGLSLAELFLLDRLFSPGSSILDQERTTLGDLIILDQLFRNWGLNEKTGLEELFQAD